MQPSAPENPLQQPQGYQSFYPQRGNFIEAMFTGTRLIVILLLSFLFIWIGLLIGAVSYTDIGQNSYVTILIIGYILYSLGVILLLFTILGVVLTQNSINHWVRVTLIVFAFIVFIEALLYPPMVSFITKIFS
jgi:hypothetical protein